MNSIRAVVQRLSHHARRSRGELFRRSFALGPESRLLDLGAGDGEHIAGILEGTAVVPANVHVADIAPASVEAAARRYGFTPVVIPQAGALPFRDGYFDVVFCSSVIEHVTLPKSEVWLERSTRRFREHSWRRQQEFASEIRRLGRGYFVQTPNRYFPIESHTWLPFVGWLPRRLVVPLLRLSNRVWVKQTRPDWNLLTACELARLFPDGRVVRERFLGLTKSITAIRAASAPSRTRREPMMPALRPEP